MVKVIRPQYDPLQRAKISPAMGIPVRVLVARYVSYGCLIDTENNNHLPEAHYCVGSSVIPAIVFSFAKLANTYWCQADVAAARETK